VAQLGEGRELRYSALTVCLANACQIYFLLAESETDKNLPGKESGDLSI